MFFFPFLFILITLIQQNMTETKVMKIFSSLKSSDPIDNNLLYLSGTQIVLCQVILFQDTLSKGKGKRDHTSARGHFVQYNI